jgi:hypothetical protein
MAGPTITLGTNQDRIIMHASGQNLPQELWSWAGWSYYGNHGYAYLRLLSCSHIPDSIFVSRIHCYLLGPGGARGLVCCAYVVECIPCAYSVTGHTSSRRGSPYQAGETERSSSLSPDGRDLGLRFVVSMALGWET